MFSLAPATLVCSVFAAPDEVGVLHGLMDQVRASWSGFALKMHQEESEAL